MTRIQQVDNVDEVVAKWTRLIAVEKPENSAELLQMFLRCLDQGALFFVYGDKGLMGTCGLVACGGYIDLLTLPRDNGVGMAKECLRRVKEWAKERQVDEIRVTTNKSCGSSFRYLKNLGFRQASVTFNWML